MWVRLLYRLGSLLIAAVLLRSCVFEIARVSDNALAPVIKSGDLLLINKMAYGLRVPGAGNYIIHWQVPQPGDYVMTNEWSDPPVSVMRIVRKGPGNEITPKNMSKQIFKPGEFALGNAAASDTELYKNGLARERNIAGRAQSILFPTEKGLHSWMGALWRPLQ